MRLGISWRMTRYGAMATMPACSTLRPRRISASGLTDPTDPEGKWAAVRVMPERRLKHTVTLAAIKAEPSLADMELVRLSRLSVAELLPSEWQAVLAMAGE